MCERVCVCDWRGCGLTFVGGQDLWLLCEGRGLLPQGAPPLRAPPLGAPPLHVRQTLHRHHQLLLVAWRTHAVCEECVFVCEVEPDRYIGGPILSADIRHFPMYRYL